MGAEGSVERALAAARAHAEFVVGFICQENVLAKNPDESPAFLYCTPGVRIGCSPPQAQPKRCVSYDRPVERSNV
jgi:hypothetical protein